jgi:hypothetical protein
MYIITIMTIIPTIVTHILVINLIMVIEMDVMDLEEQEECVENIWDVVTTMCMVIIQDVQWELQVARRSILVDVVAKEQFLLSGK